jgi:hypothetical protein
MMTVPIVDASARRLTWLPHQIQQAWFGDKVSLSSRAAYLRDGRHWVSWCRDHDVNPLAATPARGRRCHPR